MGSGGTIRSYESNKYVSITRNTDRPNPTQTKPTTCNNILLVKLPVTQLVKKFPAFYRT